MTVTLSGDATLALPEFDAPPSEPMGLFAEWVASATRRGVSEPLAMALATSADDGRPSSRIVLLKSFDAQGLVFTSYRGSRKGRDLAAVPHAAVTFYWRETLQQINVAGPVEELSDSESDQLFAERPIEAQATSAVSEQSQPLLDPRRMLARATALSSAGSAIARPADWGGYRVLVARIEFWHGSPDRLHRRLQYVRTVSGWSVTRLQP